MMSPRLAIARFSASASSSSFPLVKFPASTTTPAARSARRPFHSSSSPSSLSSSHSHQTRPRFIPSRTGSERFTAASLTQSRSMASSTKKEFLCIVPDKPGVAEKRKEVRPKHLEGVKPLVEARELVIGGAMFDSHPVEGETPSAKGSMFVLFAEDIEQVKQFLRQDVYSTSGVWDWEKATITPFRSAVRVGM